MRLSLLAVIVLVTVALTGCATDDEVRAACANHGGANAVSGKNLRKYVVCRDGYYVTVR